MKNPDRPFVQIVWGDAWATSNHEYEISEVQNEELVMVTYGFVLKADEVGVTLASEWRPDAGTFRTTTFVPRAMVKEVRELSLTKKRAAKSAATP